MVFIVGLGNPGKIFYGTRHNIGFAYLDRLKKAGNFSKWENEKVFEAKVSKGKLFGKPVFLVKPQTFMNNSGRAVLKLAKFYKALPENIWVVHDDIDLNLGRIKIVKGKSSGGHKGVKSIIKSLKTKDFIRFRIGIGRMQKKKEKRLGKFVLEKFSQNEKKIMRKVFEKLDKAVEIALKEGVQKAMTEFNKK
jgi:PTH1 family peptidyl-tRNA hydrolase